MTYCNVDPAAKEKIVQWLDYFLYLRVHDKRFSTDSFEDKLKNIEFNET